MQPTQNPPTRLGTEPATEMVTTPATTLRDAALYLERHGWTQGEFYFHDANHSTPTPPACAVGAIRVVTCGAAVSDVELYRDDHRSPEIGHIERAIAHPGRLPRHRRPGRRLSRCTAEALIAWNDHHSTAPPRGHRPPAAPPPTTTTGHPRGTHRPRGHARRIETTGGDLS